MDETRYTLQDLADLTGIEARTIRSYIERDILPGPDGLGPKAAYRQEHADRLKVLGLLRDAHRAITLDQIRALLAQLAPEQISDIANGRQKLSSAIGSGSATSSALSYLQGISVRREVVLDESERYDLSPASAGPAAGSPAFESTEFERPASASPASPSRRSMSGMPGMPAMPAKRAMSPMPPKPGGRVQSSATSGRSPLEELFEVLASALASENVTRSVRSETWQRVPITPDIELAVRGELDTDRLAMLQRIGDHLRHLLMKGAPR